MLAPAGASSGGSPGHALPGWLSGEMLSLELWRGALPGDCAFAFVAALSLKMLSLKTLSPKTLSLEVLSLELARTQG